MSEITIFTKEETRSLFIFHAWQWNLKEIIELLSIGNISLNTKNAALDATIINICSGFYSNNEWQIWVIKLLLLNWADVNFPDKSFWITPLMTAADFWNEELLNLLIEHWANRKILCKNNYTALDYAIKRMNKINVIWSWSIEIQTQTRIINRLKVENETNI